MGIQATPVRATGLPPAAARRALPVLGVLLAAAILALTPGSSSATEPRLPPLLGAAGTSPSNCASVVTTTVGHVAHQFYRHEILGRDAHDSIARVERSGPLRNAVVRGDAAGTRAALEGLTANLIARIRVFRGSHQLAEVGRDPALAPIGGPLRDSFGHLIGHFELSMGSDLTFVSRLGGLAGTAILIRSGGDKIAGTLEPGPLSVPTRGPLEYAGRTYGAYTFQAQAYPAGQIQISILVPVLGTAPLCGTSTGETVANTIGQEGLRIYSSELHGPDIDHASSFIRTAEDMLSAVMRSDPVAVRAAIVGFFRTTIHIVRVRVSRGGLVINDVGGPAVLAPVSGTFFDAAGQPIGRYLFSLQDDAGYIKQATEWTGAEVVMRVRGHPVAGSLRPGPRRLPVRGSLRYDGVTYQVFSFMATSFPDAPLRISLLIRPQAYL
jgi:hypothetical protein